jgi:hypothetical protein
MEGTWGLLKIISRSAIKIAVKTMSEPISNHAGRAPSIVLQGYRFFRIEKYLTEKQNPHPKVRVLQL